MVQQPRVLVIGSANMDFTVAVPELPQEGQTVMGGSFYTSHGGKGANQAVAARRLGAQVRFLGGIGTDPQGDQIVRQFEAEGIPIDGLIRMEDAATGVALIVVDGEGRNQIAVASGANLRLSPEAARAHETLLLTAKVLLCQLEIPLETVQWALAAAREHAVLTILNPAPACALPDSVLSLVDCLTPNAAEAERLSGVSVDGPGSAARAAQRLLARGPKRVIVTLALRGSCTATGRPPCTTRPFRCRRWTPPGRGMPSTGRWPWAWLRAGAGRRPSRWPMPRPPSPARSAARKPRSLPEVTWKPSCAS